MDRGAWWATVHGVAPNYRLSMTIPDWLQAIQNYMKTLQYPSDRGQRRRPSQEDGHGDSKSDDLSVRRWSANAV